MPNPILTDAVLCKLAENKELRGINPAVLSDGEIVWRARLFVYAAVVPVGTYPTALEAINAVRHKANVEWSFTLSDAELFWKSGQVHIKGIVFSTKDPEKPWSVFVTEDRQRYPVGSFPDLDSALDARISAETGDGVEFYRQRFEEEIERRVRERVAEHNEHRDQRVREEMAQKRRWKYQRKKSSRNRSGVVGVCWHKTSGKWQAYIDIDKRRKSLGLFPDINDAITARKRAEYGWVEGGS